MKHRASSLIAVILMALTGFSYAATITVNTADNTDFSAGKTNLVLAINSLADGDTIFAVATGAISTRANHGAIGAIAADVMAQAVVRAVLRARGLPGLPAAADLR